MYQILECNDSITIVLRFSFINFYDLAQVVISGWVMLDLWFKSYLLREKRAKILEEVLLD